MKTNPMAIFALYVSLGARHRRMTEDEKTALRERCKAAHLLELGQILMDARSNEEQKIVADEITRRTDLHP